MDPLVPVDLVGEHAAQPEGAVQRGLIECHGAPAGAGGHLCLLHHGSGEERDGRGLFQQALPNAAEELQALGTADAQVGRCIYGPSLLLPRTGDTRTGLE